MDRANVTRLHVNIGPETKKSLELLMAVEEINMTEALRRLVAYGAIVYRTIKLEHEDVLLAKDDGTTRRVTLL